MMNELSSFLLLSFWNLVGILYSQHVSDWTRHISTSAQQGVTWGQWLPFRPSLEGTSGRKNQVLILVFLQVCEILATCLSFWSCIFLAPLLQHQEICYSKMDFELVSGFAVRKPIFSVALGEHSRFYLLKM